MLVSLPWYSNSDRSLFISYTTVGIIRIKGNTFPPWYLAVSTSLLGYSVMYKGKRVSWTPELTVARQMAHDIVARQMQTKWSKPK